MAQAEIGMYEDSTEQSNITFDEKDSRKDEMNTEIEGWIEALGDEVEAAEADEAFQEWLDVMSKFHTYSVNNQLLILFQKPDATRVAGFNTWRNEFDRYVQKGESAIWIWAPITAKKCPECGNSESYCKRSDCDGTDVPKGEWKKGIVGFRPVPVFDISQTEGEPLPEVDMAATGDASDLYPAVEAAASEKGYDYELVDEDEWTRGTARGVCYTTSYPPRIEVLKRENKADQARTAIHEFAHAELHVRADMAEDEEDEEKSKVEVEAEAVAYVVAQHFGLDASGSAFYVARWQGEGEDTLNERLNRIQKAAKDLIETIEGHIERDEPKDEETE